MLKFNTGRDLRRSTGGERFRFIHLARAEPSNNMRLAMSSFPFGIFRPPASSTLGVEFTPDVPSVDDGSFADILVCTLGTRGSTF